MRFSYSSGAPCPQPASTASLLAMTATELVEKQTANTATLATAAAATQCRDSAWLTNRRREMVSYARERFSWDLSAQLFDRAVKEALQL